MKIGMHEKFESWSCGRPNGYRSTVDWMLEGVRRQGWGNLLLALLAGWSGIWIVLWIAGAAAVTGAVSGTVAALTSPGLSASVFGETSSVLGALLGGLGGLISGCLGALSTLILASPQSFAVSIIGGAVFSFLVVCYLIVAESWIMKLHGYRRLSRRESERIMPIMLAVAKRMGLTNVPELLIEDGSSKSAAAHLQHVVLGKILIDELPDEAIAGILAHELHHWRCGDTIGLRFVYASALPAILLYDLGALLTKTRHGIPILLGWVVLWPAWVIMHWVLEPVLAHRSRSTIEHECDLAANKAGYGSGLALALTYLGDFEGSTTGWLEVLRRTHPPTELRLEELEIESGSLEASA